MNCFSNDFCVTYLGSMLVADKNIIENMASFLVWVVPLPLMYFFVWENGIGYD